MRVRKLTGYAWLSIAAAIVTMGLKAYAFQVTGSVGLLSDAAESLVNLAAAVMALMMLSLAARPADSGHPFGHGKAEYFASGFEGALILIAAGGIVWAAWLRLEHPQEVMSIDAGMIVSAIASAINLMVAIILLRAGKRHGSITLEADAHHLFSDVWTTVSILGALAGIMYTGWLWLDPAIAILAACQIVWAGTRLISRSISGLLDAALPADELAIIQSILKGFMEQGIGFHDLRTRAAGASRLITLHVLVPGGWTVQQGHDLVERIEEDIRLSVPHAVVVTHLEPMEDIASFIHDSLSD